MKKSLICFVQLFVLFTIQNNYLFSQKSELYIEFSSEKTEYIIEEPVIINYTLINTKHTRITLNYNCSILSDIFEQLNLVNKAGKKFRYCCLFADCMGGKLILQPGDSINTEENGINGYAIDLLFGYGNYDSNTFNRFPHLPLGEYFLNFNSKLNGKAQVSSNTISFKVTEPQAKDGYEKFKAIDTMINNEVKYDSLHKFINEYSESCYLSNVYNDLRNLVIYKNIYPEKIFNDFQNYCKKKPNSWAIGKYLSYCSGVINKRNGEGEMINYLVKIMNKYPGTKVSIAAYNLLSKVIPNEIYLKGLKN
jgi:hypothetical protein